MAQDDSGSGQQQQYENKREYREKVDSHSVSSDPRKTQRLLEDMSSSASVSSHLPVPLSSSSHAVDDFTDQSFTNNVQGPAESRTTYSNGRNGHGIEQVSGKA